MPIFADARFSYFDLGLPVVKSAEHRAKIQRKIHLKSGRIL